MEFSAFFFVVRVAYRKLRSKLTSNLLFALRIQLIAQNTRDQSLKAWRKPLLRCSFVLEDFLYRERSLERPAKTLDLGTTGEQHGVQHAEQHGEQNA